MNINAFAGSSVAIQTNTNVTGILGVTGQADIDNIRIDGNTISSTDTNGDINLTPNGTGNVTGNLTGNASSATILQTARNIGGVSFNGSSSINLPGVNTAGNQNTSGNAATATTAANLSFGSANQVVFKNSSNNATTNANLTFDGTDLTVGGDITAFASDERLKTNISPITDALFKVNSLNGFTYNFNEIAGELGFDTEIDYAGVSAQEVQKVLPEVVRPAPVDDKYVTVQYDKLTALLIEAIKELSDKVEKLEQRLEDK